MTKDPRDQRYICVAKIALQIITKLGDETDKANFTDWLFDSVYGNGGEAIKENASKVLSLAIESAEKELWEGIRRYSGRARGGKQESGEERLVSEGYTEREINAVKETIAQKGYDIGDFYKYAKKAIDKERKKNRATNYEQRNYNEKDQEARKNFLRNMEAYESDS